MWEPYLLLADSADVYMRSNKPCIASMEDEDRFAFIQAELFKQLPEVLIQGCLRWHDALTVTCGTFLSFLPWIKSAQQRAFELASCSSSCSTVSMCSSLTPYRSIARQPVPAGSCTDRCDAPTEPSRSIIEDDESPTQSYVSATKARKEKEASLSGHPRSGEKSPTTPPIISFPCPVAAAHGHRDRAR
jgi:hypothetical protein